MKAKGILMQSPNTTYRVYKHTSVSSKGYIGYTYKPMIERWKEELSHSRNLNNVLKIDKALRKYPNKDQWNNKVLIDNIPTLAEAKRLEIEMIAKYDTYKNGYNSTPGGDGNGPMPEETRKKISESTKNKSKSEEHKNIYQKPKKTKNKPKNIQMHFLLLGKLPIQMDQLKSLKI
jgi:hypothetical protein